jgi:hypothetical protein
MKTLSYPFPQAISEYAESLEAEVYHWLYQDYKFLSDEKKKVCKNKGWVCGSQSLS